VQRPHAKLKTPLVMLEGFHVAKASAEKSVSAVQLYHETVMSDAEGRGVLNEVSDKLSRHALVTLTAVVKGVLNEVSPLDLHASVKFTLLASVPSFASCGNDVSDEQFCHADTKLEQLDMSVVLNSLSDEQLYHA